MSFVRVDQDAKLCLLFFLMFWDASWTNVPNSPQDGHLHNFVDDEYLHFVQLYILLVWILQFKVLSNNLYLYLGQSLEIYE